MKFWKVLGFGPKLLKKVLVLGKTWKTQEMDRSTYILQFQYGVFFFKLFPKINNNGGFSPTAIRIKKKSCKQVLLPLSADETQKRAILTFNFFSLLKFLNFSVFYMPANLLAYDHIKNTLFNNLWYISSRAGVTYLIKKN